MRARDRAEAIKNAQQARTNGGSLQAVVSSLTHELRNGLGG
jgi:nitrogen-specific signal transduction histidine kinase